VQTLGLFWNYTVSYSEFYENLPKVMTNRAVGKYSVYLNATSFIIESEHVTCILPGKVKSRKYLINKVSYFFCIKK